jgi:hypothetical protein
MTTMMTTTMTTKMMMTTTMTTTTTTTTTTMMMMMMTSCADEVAKSGDVRPQLAAVVIGAQAAELIIVQSGELIKCCEQRDYDGLVVLQIKGGGG